MENQATFKMVLCGDGGTVSLLLMSDLVEYELTEIGYVMVSRCSVISLPSPSSRLQVK